MESKRCSKKSQLLRATQLGGLRAGFSTEAVRLRDVPVPLVFTWWGAHRKLRVLSG